MGDSAVLAVEADTHDCHQTCCTDLVIGCMDKRFVLQKRHAMRAELGEREFFMPTSAGGPYVLSPWGPGEEFNAALELHRRRMHVMEVAQANTLFNLQAAMEQSEPIKRVALCWHEDCRVMKMLGHEIKDRERLMQFVAYNAKSVNEWLRSQFPRLEVLNYLLYIDDQKRVQVNRIAD